MKHIAPLRPQPAPHPSPSQDSLLRHRISMATTLLQSRHNSAYSTFTTTTTGSLAFSSSSSFRTAPDDFRLSTEKISLGYVSLQDLLPSASAPVDSPKSNESYLSKQTAVRKGFLHRLWPPRVPTFFRHIFQALTRLSNWLLEAIRIRKSR
ncbi:Hypothetical predicted protein [Olea europaea subsp. europaea]|uniref:Uncharacterized protein n=1 Tax=Olea europaea subsp. europaea TaxID=158383 RepID=A0A8S0UHE9_OLEEU|nr:Hypothetical predicted protein [Olea europaea subsp. europaea]